MTIVLHYIPDTDTFYADHEKHERSVLKEAGFWFNFGGQDDFSQKAARRGVPPKKSWTYSWDAAARLRQFADLEAAALLDKREAIINQSMASTSDIQIPLPKGLSPYPFQRAGIEWAHTRSASLIADEMGLGKTIQGLLLINLDQSIETVLLFCLASLRINWEEEAKKWLTRKVQIARVKQIFDIPKRKPGHVLILISGFQSILCSFEKEIIEELPNGKKRKTIIKVPEGIGNGCKLWRTYMNMSFDLIIIDEAHVLKNPEAQISRNILGYQEYDKKTKQVVENKGIIANCRKKVFLTGTPIKNRPIEFWQLGHALDPELFPNFMGYAYRYCAAQVKSIWAGKSRGMIQTFDTSGSSNREELNRKLRSTIMIRRLKKDVLTELPPKTRQIILLEPPDEETKEAIRSQIEKLKAIKPELATALEKATLSQNDADYIAVTDILESIKVPLPQMSKERSILAEKKIPAAIEYIKTALEGMDNGQEKIVVFAHHRKVVDALAESLAEYNPVKVYGGMNDEQKGVAVKAFQNDPNVKVFIGNIGAAGTGLTLTASNLNIFVELDWAPSQVVQAEDRIHRIGQSKPALIQHLVFNGSLDAKIVKTLVEKMAIIADTLDISSKVKEVTPEEVPIKIEVPIIPGGNPAEQIQQIQQIRQEAKEKGKKVVVETTFTEEQKNAAHIGLQILAEVCDYARTKDGMGFNAPNARDGHYMAEQLGELEDRHMPRAMTILSVHRNQLPDWIRDILGLWPKGDRLAYTEAQKNAVIAAVLWLQKTHEQDMNADQKSLLQDVNKLDISKGAKAISEKLTEILIRDLIRPMWKFLDNKVAALLLSQGIKERAGRGRPPKGIENTVTPERSTILPEIPIVTEKEQVIIKTEEEKPKVEVEILEGEKLVFAVRYNGKYKTEVRLRENGEYVIDHLVGDKIVKSQKAREKSDVQTVMNDILIRAKGNNLKITLFNNDLGLIFKDIPMIMSGKIIDEVIRNLGAAAFIKGIERSPSSDNNLAKLLASEYVQTPDNYLEIWLSGWDAEKERNVKQDIEEEIVAQPEQEIIIVQPEPEPEKKGYTKSQKTLAKTAIKYLSQYFDLMPEDKKAAYKKEYISKIKKMASTVPEIPNDKQVNEIISIIKMHRRVFDTDDLRGIFEKLGVKLRTIK